MNRSLSVVLCAARLQGSELSGMALDQELYLLQGSCWHYRKGA